MSDRVLIEHKSLLEQQQANIPARISIVPAALASCDLLTHQCWHLLAASLASNVLSHSRRALLPAPLTMICASSALLDGHLSFLASSLAGCIVKGVDCSFTLTRHFTCRKIRLATQKIAKANEQIEEGVKDWDPSKDEKVEVRLLVSFELSGFQHALEAAQDKPGRF